MTICFPDISTIFKHATIKFKFNSAYAINSLFTDIVTNAKTMDNLASGLADNAYITAY